MTSRAWAFAPARFLFLAAWTGAALFERLGVLPGAVGILRRLNACEGAAGAAHFGSPVARLRALLRL